MIMNHILLLVDGITEIRALRAKFWKEYSSSPGLIKVDCNGRDVTAIGYANKVVPLILYNLTKKYNKIICIVDREQRKDCVQKFTSDIHNAILEKIESTNSNLDNISISVCVPDIMFENWIIADVEGLKIREYLMKSNISQDFYDGKSGTTILCKMMKTPYKKTQHAELLFKAIDFKRGKRYSPSFSTFCEKLNI